MRLNPGPFEPFFYLLQTRISYRVLGIIGLILFTILFLSIAAAHGASYAIVGLLLLGALLFESSTAVCRRCRFYGTWHCLGQGMLVARLFSRIEGGLSESGVGFHAALAGAYVVYGLFWMWHRPGLGFLFTLWVPFAFISLTTPSGFSWRARKTA
ncbi:MAG: hypothetical protein ACLQAT_22295 [Candidatus Binataceae bacterium]